MKRFYYYFACTVIVGIIIYLGTMYQTRLLEEAKMNFELSSVIRFGTIFPIIIGMFLRLPKSIIEVKEKRHWTFDWIKIAAVALPALYIATLPHITAEVQHLQQPLELFLAMFY